MPRYSRRRRTRRKMGNSVVHVPSSIAGTLALNTAVVIIVASPSIFAAGSASSNIEAQDKDRTVNVGHHVGRLNIDLTIRQTISDGALEACVFKVERADSTPTLGSHPCPSSSEINSQGMQQACRLANPGRVYYTSNTAYSLENTRTKKVNVSPAKYRVSKMKAGDHWVLMLFNRGNNTITYDFQARYNEYE